MSRAWPGPESGPISSEPLLLRLLRRVPGAAHRARCRRQCAAAVEALTRTPEAPPRFQHAGAPPLACVGCPKKTRGPGPRWRRFTPAALTDKVLREIESRAASADNPSGATMPTAHRGLEATESQRRAHQRAIPQSRCPMETILRRVAAETWRRGTCGCRRAEQGGDL